MVWLWRFLRWARRERRLRAGDIFRRRLLDAEGATRRVGGVVVRSLCVVWGLGIRDREDV